jgi:predicted Na+-dependent transporter
MQYLLPSVVFLLMVSIGLSLKPTMMIARWKRLSWFTWLRLVTATFLIPPAIALLVANLFHLTRGEMVGLFMVGAAPGAPLLTRNMARKGFDMHLAASYQVWAALMIPIMIPLVVIAAAKLYGRNIWIPPTSLFQQIVYKQLLPLAVGMAIAWLIPQLAQRFQPVLNMLGNLLFTGLIAVVLFKMGPALKDVTPLVPVAVLLLAAGSMGAILLVRLNDTLIRQTFAICNANRHVGLALLLSNQYVQARNALPVVACYALLIPFIVIACAKYYSGQKQFAVTES